MARKEVVAVWTGDGFQYHVSRRTGVVSATRDGETSYPDEMRAEKVRRVVASRDRASVNRRAKDDAMRSISMVKVRGNLGGTYWE